MALTQISTDGIKNGTITGSDLATNVDLVDNQKIRFGTGNDLEIYHDGSNSLIVDNGTGGLILGVAGTGTSGFYKGTGQEPLATFEPDGPVSLYHNNAKKFETTSTGATLTGKLTSDGLVLGDSETIAFGNTTNGDFKIYHDGTNASIQNITGSLNIFGGSGAINIKAENSEQSIVCSPNNQVELYHNGVKKFETTSAGVEITGTGTNTVEINGNGGHELYSYHDSAGVGWATGTGESGNYGELIYLAESGSQIQFYTGGSLRQKVLSTGIEVIGDVNSSTGIFEHTTNFTSQLKFNGSNETQLKHLSNGQVKLSFVGLSNAARGSIDAQSGFIQIKTAADETGIICRDNSSTDLHFDGSKKFETTSTGAAVHHSNFCTLEIRANTQDAVLRLTSHNNDNTDWAIQNDQSESNILDFRFNNTSKMHLTSDGSLHLVGNLDLEDNDKLKLGAGDDLQIYHDGSNSFIQDSGTGDLFVRTTAFKIQGSNSDDMIAATQSGAVELYHNNSKKFETTSYGNLSAGQVRVSASNASTVAFSVGDVGTGFYNSGSNAIGYSANGTQKWNIGSGGHISLLDDVQLRLGTDNDLQIYHDGTTNYIESPSSNFAIRVANGNRFEINGTNGDVTMQGSSGRNFLWDNSAAYLNLNDNARLTLGTSNDLHIYHNGSGSYIADTGTGELILKSNSISFTNAAETEHLARFFQDSGVELYNNGTKKFATGGSGVYHNNNGTLSQNAIHFERGQNTGDFSTIFGVTNYPDASGYGDQDDGYWAAVHSKGGMVVVLNTDGGRNDGRNNHDHFSIYTKANNSSSGKRAFSVDHTGGIQCGKAGINIDREWENQPSFSMTRDCNDGTNNTDNNAYFRFHGTGRTHAQWTGGSSGNDFSANMLLDGGNYNASDRRAKTDIVDCPYGLDVVNKLKPRKYQLVNSQLEPQGDDNINLGFIAQEIMEHIPECVNYLGDKANTPNEKGFARAYALDTNEIVAVLTKAIQELAAKVAVLESKT